HLYATLRAIAGEKFVEVDVPPNTTAMELAELLIEKEPALKAELFDENNRFYSHMKLFINGREAVYLEKKFDTIIKTDDKIDIFPPVGGG
ncbi:MAG: MoaD family protein, partial [Anaerolineales bacterium]|nr:MoaD family protein [Candidatus Desulfolinea nitratireducens]